MISEDKSMLSKLLRDWRRRRNLAHLVRAFAASIPTGVIAFLLIQISWPGVLAIVTIIFIATAAGLLFYEKRSSFDERTIARHLNRILPNIDESCELLLEPGENLNALTLAQQEKTAQLIKSQIEQISLPKQPLFSALRFAGIVAGVTTLILAANIFLPQISLPQSSPRMANSSNHDASLFARQKPITIKKIQTQITPPIYTKRKTRTIQKLALRIEENASVNWRLDFDQPIDSVTLIFSDGDTLALKKNDQRAFSAEKRIRTSGFYFVAATANNGMGWSSDYAKIDVIKDAPPDLTLLKPEARTELEWTDSREIAVEMLASDDYGVSKIFMIATVTKGGGENVKFREDTLKFDVRKREKNFDRYSKTLDPGRLGMAPGDELYFHVEAIDNREPEPNLARTETRFVVILDTSEVMALSTEGIAINVVPDYFRSQRQIIIETIELIKEKENISQREFKSRSNELAHDQKSLRLRYGQFLGEEFDSGIPEGGPDLEALGFEDDNAAFGEHDHAEEMAYDPEQGFVGLDLSADGIPLENDNEFIQQFLHDHDNAENATLFSQSVRSQLKDALTEMWAAELQLRLFEPKQALPYEYQALKLLKSVQQRSRKYVKRIGFDPPPLQPEEKRLTGDLEDISGRKLSSQAEPVITLPEVRAGLRVIERVIGERAPPRSEEIAILENAGQKLAVAAISEPGNYLEALQNLRDFIESVENAGGDSRNDCSACLSNIRGAFWRMLPPEPPSPNKTTRPQNSLEQKYFRALESIR